MSLTNAQKKFLRGLTHDLQPVVMIADKGLTDNVMAELESALEHHELIKVKLRGDRDSRGEWVEAIVERTGGELVHRIGQVAAFYRRNPDKPRINLPGK